MSVKIPISADASQAVSAFNQITVAIRKAGQEGRQFSELDLSHRELKPFADDIKQVQNNFEELKKTGRGSTATAVRAGNYPDFMAWEKSHARQFPDEKQRKAHTKTVSDYVTQGTQFEPQKGWRDKLSLSGASKVLGIGLGLAGIGKVISSLSEGISGAQEEAMTLDVFKRQLNDTSSDFDAMRQSLRDASAGLEITYNETVKLAQQFAKASAYTEPQRINKEIQTSVGFARSFGLDEKQVTQTFGESRWAGIADKDTDPKDMAMMFADAIASGNMWTKGDQVMSAILGWVNQSEDVMVDPPNVEAYAAYSSAMNASNRPGLQGQSGTALVAKIDGAIRNNGQAGDAGRNFIWRALSTEGQMSPFQMQYLLEEGMFGNRENAFKHTAPKLAEAGRDKDGAHHGKTNFENIKSMLDREYNNAFQKWDAMSNLLGISMHQASALDELKTSEYGKLGKMLDQYHLKPKDINPTAFQGLASVAVADDKKLASLREDVLKRDDVSAEKKQALEAAEPGEDLRKVLAMTLAEVGKEHTIGSETKQAVVDLKNELIKVGEKLLKPINEIKDSVASLVGGGNDIVDHFLSPTGNDQTHADRFNRLFLAKKDKTSKTDIDKPVQAEPDEDANPLSAMKADVLNVDNNEDDTLLKSKTHKADTPDPHIALAKPNETEPNKIKLNEAGLNDEESPRHFVNAYSRALFGEKTQKIHTDEREPEPRAHDSLNPAVKPRVLNLLRRAPSVAAQPANTLKPSILNRLRRAPSVQSQPANTVKHEVAMMPLEVIHRNEHGTVIQRENLPMAKIVKTAQ